MSWRDHARPIIARVIAANPKADERELRRILGRAYPWGERANHPYRVWLDEINVQLGRRQFGSSRKPPQPCEGQQVLFVSEDQHV